jgi:hypothetical protein
MKWAYGGLSLVFLLLGLLTLWREDKEMVVVLAPRVMSFVHTDGLETIAIDLLASRTDTHHLDETYIERATIHDEMETMSFDVQSVIHGDTPVPFGDESMIPVQLQLAPRVEASASTISMAQATLDVVYLDGTSWSVAIGSFTYRFDPGQEGDLALWSLRATSEDIVGFTSVSAIQIELYNRTRQRIDVLHVEVLAAGVATHPAMARINQDCTDLPNVATCLDVFAYDWFQDPLPHVLHASVSPKQSVMLYVPLVYQEVLPLHRFGLVVTYAIDGEQRELVIDDFPFIRSDPFAAQAITGVQRRVLD